MKLYFAGLAPKEFDFVREKREDYAPHCGGLCTFYDISDNRLNDLVAASKGEYVFKPRGKKKDKEEVLKSSGIEDEVLSQDEALNTPELDSCASKPLKKKKKKKKGKKK